jgi:hypothetical protein
MDKLKEIIIQRQRYKEKQIYIDENGKKYKWKPKICICPLNYSMNKLKNSNYNDLRH